MKTFNTMMAIQTSIYVNMILFYVRKLPFLRKLIKESVFAKTGLKRGISLLVHLIVLLGHFALSFAYVWMVLYLPIIRFGHDLAEERQLAQFAHEFAVISFIVAGVSSAAILEPKRGKYIAVKLMRMSPAGYMKATLSHKYALFFIRLLPAMLWVGPLVGASPWTMALLVLTATMSRVFWEYVHLKWFEKTGAVLVKQVGLVWAVIIIGFIAAYLPLFRPEVPAFGEVVLLWPVQCVLIAAGFFAAVYLARYSGYRTAVDAATKRDDPFLDMRQAVQNANQSSVKMNESDYELNDADSEKMRSGNGYRYLNGLFFARHRKLIRRPLNIRLAVIGGLLVAGLAAIYLFGSELSGMLPGLLETRLPLLVIAMFYLSTGEKVTRAMFYHCDMSLLRYRVYRNAAFTHFLLRLERLVVQNAVVAAALAAALTVVCVWAGGAWNGNILLIWISALALSVFFSVHHLFLYYLLQPYTTELNIRNPIFTVANSILGGLSGICLIIRVPSLIFTIVVAGLTILYLLLALVLVRKYATRTFRVK